jgi:hypothetical protein
MDWNQAKPEMVDTALRLDEAVAEFCLLLPAWQAVALEKMAQARGVTAGHLMRSLVHDYLAGQVGAEGAYPEELPGTVFGPKTVSPV